MRDEYPPEYDSEGQCEVCLRGVSDCDCPECPICGEAGNPKCYTQGHMKPAKDSIEAVCNHIGVDPISVCLRAIDKYNPEHLWLVFHGPLPGLAEDKTRVYYYDHKVLEELDYKQWLRLAGVGVGGSAGDGSDWEWGTEGRVDEIDSMREMFHELLDEHDREKAEEVEDA